MYSIGIDWADENHYVCILDSERKKVDSFEIDHGPSGFDFLKSRIDQLGCPKEQIGLLCETRHNLLISHLMSLGYQVFVANPKSVDRYRDRYRLSDSKSDGADAFVIASMLITDSDSLKPLEPDPPQAARIGQLHRFRARLVAEHARTLNELTSCLKSYYPRALELFELGTAVFAKFLRRYPIPKDLSREDEAGFMAFLKDAQYTRPYAAKKLFKTAAAPQIEIDDILENNSVFARMLVDRLELLSGQIKRLDAEIEKLVDAFKPAAIFTTLPGASYTTAAGLVAELGGVPGRYSSASAVQCLAGTAPVTRQSGKYKYVKFRRSCNKRLRNTVQQLAFSSISRCDWAREFYDNQRAKGVRHNAALRALGNKWTKIIHVMIERQLPYDESRYLQMKQRFSSIQKEQKVLVKLGA